MARFLRSAALAYLALNLTGLTAFAAPARVEPPAELIAATPWPAGVRRLTLTWVVYPVVMRGKDGEIPTRQIELVVRAGAVARRFAKQEAYSVSYATAMQRRCREPGFAGADVAELYMNGGGNTVLAVERHGDELTLVERTSADGLCEPGPCPVHATTLARIPIPPGVSLVERFHVVDGPRAEHDETC